MDHPTYLIHYGIEGQKWGVRRFQNEDGTWTEDGLVRRRKDQKHLFRKQERLGKKFDRYTQKMESDMQKGKKISDRRIEKANKLGAKFRTLDYVSKDPETYFKARKLRTGSLAKFGVNTLTVAAGLGKVVDSSKEMKNIEKAIYTSIDNINNTEFDSTMKRFAMEKTINTLGPKLENATRIRNISGVFTAVNLARTVSELAVEQYQIDKMLKTHYKDVYEKSYKEIAKDLKKHGFEKNNELSDAKQSRIKALISSGKSQEEVAKILGVSTSTVNKYK